MTSVLYFLHLKTLFCLLLISVLLMMLFINKMFLLLIFNSFLLLLRRLKGGKTKVKNGMVIYVLYIINIGSEYRLSGT